MRRATRSSALSRSCIFRYHAKKTTGGRIPLAASLYMNRKPLKAISVNIAGRISNGQILIYGYVVWRRS